MCDGKTLATAAIIGAGIATGGFGLAAGAGEIGGATTAEAAAATAADATAFTSTGLAEVAGAEGLGVASSAAGALGTAAAIDPVTGAALEAGATGGAAAGSAGGSGGGSGSGAAAPAAGAPSAAAKAGTTALKYAPLVSAGSSLLGALNAPKISGASPVVPTLPQASSSPDYNAMKKKNALLFGIDSPTSSFLSGPQGVGSSNVGRSTLLGGSSALGA